MQISEAYYFKLVEGTANSAHIGSGLIDDTTLLEKPGYFLFKSFNKCSSYLPDYPSQNQLIIRPNPSENISIIEFNNFSDKDEKTLVIFDLAGNKIKQIKNIYENHYVITKNDLKPGYYIICIYDGKIELCGKLIRI